MIDLISIIERDYKSFFSAESFKIIYDNNIQIFDTNDLAIRIYKIQNLIKLFGKERESQEIGKELSILSNIQKIYCCCEIYHSSKIGRNFMLVHGLGTVIGSNVEVGNDCTIYHNVTIGTRYYTDKIKPKIGNNVIVYAGVKVIGNICIGDNAVIGANSVVTKDVPVNEVWAGVPAKKLTVNNSTKYKLQVGVK